MRAHWLRAPPLSANACPHGAPRCRGARQGLLSLFGREAGFGGRPRALEGPRQRLHHPLEATTFGRPSGLVVNGGDHGETRREFGGANPVSSASRNTGSTFCPSVPGRCVTAADDRDTCRQPTVTATTE